MAHPRRTCERSQTQYSREISVHRCAFPLCAVNRWSAWDVAGASPARGGGRCSPGCAPHPPQPTQVDALELVADADHAVLGVRNHAREELAGVQLDGQLFTVFTLRGGHIVHLHDNAHRSDALAEAGLDDYKWR